MRSKGDHFVVDLGEDEAALVRRLVGELRAMLTDPDPGSDARLLLVRLFPVTHPDDEDQEAEYQRLMRDELVQSKLSAFELVDELLAPGTKQVVDEPRLIAFMQSVNSIRLVLGTMLGVSDDADEEVAAPWADSPEYHLYAYLSYLLDHCVRALSPHA